MTVFGADDLAAFMADAPSSMTIGGVTVPVWSRTTDDTAVAGDYADENVDGTITEVTFPTGAFPALALGVTATLDGVTYEVRDFRRFGDGAFTKAYLGEAGT